jgi:hypothetical protein
MLPFLVNFNLIVARFPLNMWFSSSFVGKQFLSSLDLRFGFYDRKHKSARSPGKAGRHFYTEGENFGSKCIVSG